MPVNRREFLKQTGTIAASSYLTQKAFQSSPPPGPKGRRAGGNRPRAIIHLVSDGMSAGTLMCADQLSHLLRGRGLAWIRLMQESRGHNGLMNMRSLNSLVTDSSAASSSWGSGSRIVNGGVNILPDGRELRTLYHLFGEAGWKRGLVTTTEITHATPAGFAACGLKRDAAETIATQYLDRKVEVLLGGGQQYFDPEKRKDKRDLYADFAQAGYAVLKTAADLEKASLEKRWLGTFSSGHLPFTIDHLASDDLKTKVPTLPVMTRAALRQLDRAGRFILQVEGGRVDHAAHGCDAAAAFHDQIAFDDAIEVCLEFQQTHPDTLMVITTDHGNGNPGLNGTGDAYSKSSQVFANLKQIRCSGSELLNKLEKKTDAAEIKKIIQEWTGYDVPIEKAGSFARFLEKKGEAMYDTMNSSSAQLGQLLANHTGIGWISGNHTGDYVPVLAIGPGAERFGGFIQNTDLFRHYTDLAKIDFRNPEAPLIAGRAPDLVAEDVSSYA